MKTIVLSAVLVALLPVSPARAQQREQPPDLSRITPEDFIKRYDRDNDGALSKREVPPALTEGFDRVDANRNGKLDRAEVAEMLRGLRNRRPGQPPQANPFVDRLLERLDTNKDELLDKKEARGPLADNFDRLDANKDGFLDRQELSRAGGRPGGGPGPRPDFARRPIDFDDFDLNADGRLTREELRRTALIDRFSEIDANKDGKIDPTEFETYQKKQAQDR